ncbi:MAG: cytochrome c [Bacteroidia bacterium]|nr:cytochrome c [Bacteroidia bacterium]
MNEAISLTHRITVTLFFLIYVVKTVLLLSNRADLLQKFTKTTKVPEMIVSSLFLITGVYLMMGLEHISTMLWVKVILVVLSIPIAIVGFKKNNKILAALSLLMITASYGLAEVQKKKREKGEVVATTNSNGGEIYALKCANCHGADGKLGFSGAADISKTMMSADSIKLTILNGKGLMMAVDITDEQAAAVAAYVEAEVKGK